MTPERKVTIHLSDDQRHILQRILSAGTHPSHLLSRARILLKADADGPDAWSDEEIAEHLETSRMTDRSVGAATVRRRWLDATPRSKKPTGRTFRTLDASRPVFKTPSGRPIRSTEQLRFFGSHRAGRPAERAKQTDQEPPLGAGYPAVAVLTP